MNIIQVTIKAQATCRHCGTVQPLDGWGDTYEEAEKKVHEELEWKDWTDGFCWKCAGKRFLDPADKADHDNKCQRELAP